MLHGPMLQMCPPSGQRIPLLCAIKAGDSLTSELLFCGAPPLSMKAPPGSLCCYVEFRDSRTGATMLLLPLLISQQMIKPFVSDPRVLCFLSAPKQLCKASFSALSNLFKLCKILTDGIMREPMVPP